MEAIDQDQLKRLAEAVELLETPGKHCVGVLAQDKYGNSVMPDARGAEKFCALGAFYLKGVTWHTRTIFAEYLAKHSRISKEAWNGKSRLGDKVDAAIYELNDYVRSGKSVGMNYIRRFMVKFIHAQVKLQNK